MGGKAALHCQRKLLSSNRISKCLFRSIFIQGVFRGGDQIVYAPPNAAFFSCSLTEPVYQWLWFSVSHEILNKCLSGLSYRVGRLSQRSGLLYCVPLCALLGLWGEKLVYLLICFLWGEVFCSWLDFMGHLSLYQPSVFEAVTKIFFPPNSWESILGTFSHLNFLLKQLTKTSSYSQRF